MRDYQSLNHTTWDCKYPVVFIPKSVRRRYLERSASTLENTSGTKRKKMNTIINSSLACEAAFRRRQFLAPLSG